MSTSTTPTTPTALDLGATTRGPVPPAPRRGVVLVLLVAATMTIMANAVIAPGLPGLEAEFADMPHADLLVRLMLTMPALFIIAAAPVLEVVIDRIGRRNVLLASLALYGLAGSSGFFLDDLTSVARTDSHVCKGGCCPASGPGRGPALWWIMRITHQTAAYPSEAAQIKDALHGCSVGCGHPSSPIRPGRGAHGGR